MDNTERLRLVELLLAKADSSEFEGEVKVFLDKAEELLLAVMELKLVHERESYVKPIPHLEQPEGCIRLHGRWVRTSGAVVPFTAEQRAYRARWLNSD